MRVVWYLRLRASDRSWMWARETRCWHRFGAMVWGHAVSPTWLLIFGAVEKYACLNCEPLDPPQSPRHLVVMWKWGKMELGLRERTLVVKTQTQESLEYMGVPWQQMYGALCTRTIHGSFSPPFGFVEDELVGVSRQARPQHLSGTCWQSAAWRFYVEDREMWDREVPGQARADADYENLQPLLIDDGCGIDLLQQGHNIGWP